MNPAEQIETLFIAHYEALHRYAFTILKDHEDAKDAVQAVFLHIWEKRGRIAVHTSFRAYLFRSVYNHCINQLKKRAAEERHYSHMVPEIVSDLALKDQLEEEQFYKRKVDQVLAQLPPQCREVFIKSRAAQKKYADIAQELGISIKTVEAHMSKALKLIRQALRVLLVIMYLIIDSNR